MKVVFKSIQSALLLGVGVLAIGCGRRPEPHHGAEAKKEQEPATPAAKSEKERKVEAARAKLDPADRALVEEQEFCPVMPKQKLGGMGVPVKVIVKGQPVFLCCKGCKSTAEEEPDETLKTVADLKAKNKK
ncbi:MAG: hypothetical protein U0797_07955 [Gemmataceae bacterium]|jgi:hypothetical protein